MVLFGCRGLQNAVADGDTRTISMHHIHTNEDITITYKRNGRYDEAALEKLNWLLRDWRRGQEIRMDPQLIDLLWEVQRETGSKQPIYVVCGYRSPETNAMLRRRSSGVARFSQHMLGHAVDFYIPGAALEELRVIGLRMQRGGVGFYPTSGSPFVHMDTGGVRMWPRMTRDQLLHVFPDGRTVYLPSDGRPLSGYAVALAELKKRGQNPTETWVEEARAAPPNTNIVMASAQVQRFDGFDSSYDMTQADREEDAREAAEAPVSSAAALRAALEREAARRREQAAVAATAAINDGVAAYQTASYTEPSSGEPPVLSAGLTPNQIILQRGYWRDATDAASADAVAALSEAAARRALYASAADVTGTITPAAALDDTVRAELRLSHAQRPKLAAPSTTPAERRAMIAQAQPSAGTTIAIKRTADQVASTVVAARPLLASAVGKGARFDNPWLEAILISPSVRRYLTALALGDEDYTALAPLVQKPSSSVIMTFGAAPNPGLTQDHFSGSAIVFMSTVNYQKPTHTASLR